MTDPKDNNEEPSQSKEEVNNKVKHDQALLKGKFPTPFGQNQLFTKRRNTVQQKSLMPSWSSPDGLPSIPMQGKSSNKEYEEFNEATTATKQQIQSRIEERSQRLYDESHIPMVINSLAVALNTRYHFRDKAGEPASTPQCTSQSPNDLTSFTELKFKGKDESRK
eukprot:CAMPEP_0168345130 /NCGR_PEP_ID=MMETSP0213-20121227/17339_1 /TAXON_ID=151035 /ORGANISM="Euplotes harpa, Strain FSP1.4" /LENGTH=164 /DNA_ID=CAMNT_0008353225 /DNA_START=61 /DNA_END=553 /DNA_ORIENTATION=+